jgi:glycosyltransferase involved in cell wall biosynthesis
MRLAYLTETYPPEVNGVATTVEHTVRTLRERGVDVRLIRPRQRGEPACDDETEWRTAGCPLPMYPELRFGLATPWGLRRRLQRWGCDLLHIATPGPLAWAGLRAARSLGLPTSSDFRTNFHTYTRHYGFGPLAPLALGLLRRFHNLTDCTFVPTPELRDELAAGGWQRLAVVGRGVDTRRYGPQHRSAALRAQWGAGEHDVVLLHVGRLAPEKNVPLALRAFEQLRATRPDVRLVLVGDGPSRAALQAAHPEACFVGTQRGEALAACYASADLFVFPSLSETFGNVTLEALASGLPVVAYRTAAAALHVTPGQAGWLAEPGDEAGFVGAVQRLATHAALQPLREGALQAGQRARWDEVLARFEHHLLGLVHARQTTPAVAARA